MTRAELRKKHNNIYQWILRNNRDLLDKYFPNSRTKWTFKEIKKEALKYNTRLEFQKGSGGAYNTAYRNNWLDKVCSHIKKPNNWTFEALKKEALKYRTRNEFRKGSVNAYNAAYRNKWLDKVCSHMVSGFGKMVINLDTREVFNSIIDASKSSGLKGSASICMAVKNKRTAGGYRWAYCDENGKVIK